MGATGAEPEDDDTERREEGGRKRKYKNLTETEKEERGEKGVHSFWRQGTVCISYVQIKDSNADKERGEPPDKILEKNKKENNNKYQEKFW